MTGSKSQHLLLANHCAKLIHLLHHHIYVCLWGVHSGREALLLTDASISKVFLLRQCAKFKYLLTLSWQRPLSYRNQSIDLLCKSMDWFLYDNGLRHERVNGATSEIDTQNILHFENVTALSFQSTIVFWRSIQFLIQHVVSNFFLTKKFIWNIFGQVCHMHI